eukprot:TRINITY_DN11495_c0_g1_i2.p1 TRINITY_DN11495_c0_g1~~TRINITY_DN11495_c0_g1_i2.p1  ORF type:complete len:829 (+),score=218.42 TRINITY_DN11495_c0_g1_i2:29-2488(+)
MALAGESRRGRSAEPSAMAAATCYERRRAPRPQRRRATLALMAALSLASPEPLARAASEAADAADAAGALPRAWWELEDAEAAAAGASGEGGGAAAANASTIEPPSYDWQPFKNWDCVGKKRVADWDTLYSQVAAGLRGNMEEARAPPVGAGGGELVQPYFFVLPDDMVDLMQTRASELREECPLGMLYFLTIYTYELLQVSGGGDVAVQQADLLTRELRRFPFFVIAGARWPTFEALHHFSQMHKPQSARAMRTSLCEGVSGTSGVEWDKVLAAARDWADEQTKGLEPGQGNIESSRTLKAAADQVYKDHKGKGAYAQVECPFGFLFLCTTQVLAAAVRLTGAFEPWGRALDRMLAELPFYSVAGSGWPTFRMLAFFSGLFKGSEFAGLGSFQADVHRWGTAHPQTKRFRRYGDLRLGEPELKGPWSGPEAADALAKLSPEAWHAELLQQRTRRLQPAAVAALEAVVGVLSASIYQRERECGYSGMTAEACMASGCHWKPQPSSPAEAGLTGPSCTLPRPRRKVVGVTFVWGEKWASLVPSFVGWASRLALGVVVVAMGQACRNACETAVAAHGGTESSGVACWDPLREDAEGSRAERGSILQRHAMVHLLLHLGVDALAFDFDTFFFGDPRTYLEAKAEAEGADILMARHLDADCLNMGFMYVQASSRTADWYGRYLAWLHQHTYEREQRGINALTGFTKQSVSFAPKDMPPVRAASLDDSNEFASSRGGWLGDWGRLRFFHWVNPMQTQTGWSDIKVKDLRALYAAALRPDTDLGLSGGSLALLLAYSPVGTALHEAKLIMESMRVPELPVRQECW